jgi:hypothetical protein
MAHRDRHPGGPPFGLFGHPTLAGPPENFFWKVDLGEIGNVSGRSSGVHQPSVSGMPTVPFVDGYRF